jgi:hypothetical protein
MVDLSFGVCGCSTDQRRAQVLAVEILGWVGSALLVYSVLQTRILRLRLFNGVASELLVIFNAAIAVWPMVALNVTLTAINVSISCGCYAAGTTCKPSTWSRSLRTRPT